MTSSWRTSREIRSGPLFACKAFMRSAEPLFWAARLAARASTQRIAAERGSALQGCGLNGAAIQFLLIFQAIWGPGNRLQTSGFNGAAANGAFPVTAVFH